MQQCCIMSVHAVTLTEKHRVTRQPLTAAGGSLPAACMPGIHCQGQRMSDHL